MKLDIARKYFSIHGAWTDKNMTLKTPGIFTQNLQVTSKFGYFAFPEMPHTGS